MFGWLRRLVGRPARPVSGPERSAAPDGEALLAEVEHDRERRLEEAVRDADRFQDRVLEDQQHYLMRQGR